MNPSNPDSPPLSPSPTDSASSSRPASSAATASDAAPTPPLSQPSVADIVEALPPTPGSWEAIANEILPLNAPSGGLATGARRGRNPRYPGTSVSSSGVTSFARPQHLHAVAVPVVDDALPFEDALRGRVVSHPTNGDFYFYKRASADVDNSFANIPSRLEMALKTERFPALSETSLDELLFLDIETLGLSSDAPLFLVGLLYFDGGGKDSCLEQLLARDETEEKALLAYLTRITKGRTLVTFNGRSFDWPYIRRRTIHHGLKVGAPGYHFDLLQHARRTWRDHVPNCRLQTLELYLCGRERRDDVPSAQVPAEYERFVEVRHATGRGASIVMPVLHHNALDVLTMAELLCLAGDRAV